MIKRLALPAAALVLQCATAQACVSSENATYGHATVFYNGCRSAVLVRFIQEGGGTGMSDRIPVGGTRTVARIAPGSRYSWCEVGDKQYWTCN